MKRGAILLEVILSIALLAASAGVVLTALGQAQRSLRMMRLEAQAEDLAVSTLSMIEMGLLPAADDGPNEYRDDPGCAGWTWEIATRPLLEQDANASIQLTRVEVIIRFAAENYALRLAQIMPARLDDGQDEEDQPAVQEIAP